MQSKIFFLLKIMFFILFNIVLNKNSFSQSNNQETVHYSYLINYFSILMECLPTVMVPDLKRGEFETVEEFAKRQSNERLRAEYGNSARINELIKNSDKKINYVDIPICEVKLNYDANKQTFESGLKICFNVYEHNKRCCNLSTSLSLVEVNSLINSPAVNIFLKIKLPPKAAASFKDSYFSDGPHKINMVLLKKYIEEGEKTEIEIVGCCLLNKDGKIVYDFSSEF